MRTKYVTIERGPEFNRTAVTLEVAKDIEKRGLGTIGTPITLKRIKDDRIHIYRDQDYFCHMAERDYEDAFETGTVFNATVLSFDLSRGQGLIRVDDGSDGGSITSIYACNLPGRKTWYPETACTYYEVGTEVQVTFEFKLAVSHTPAIIDEAKWTSLDQSKLAFKCDADGQAINGLFGGAK